MKKCTTATIIGAFFRFPKELLTHPKYKKLSAEAMILYGLLLDRLCLSLKNGWLDQNGDVYIYFSREEAMKLFSCGPDKIARLFKELKEVHLVEKVQQGLHRPDKIYVGEILPDTDTRTEEQPSDTTQAMSHLHQCLQNSSVRMLVNQRPQISDIQRPQISDIQRPQISDIQRPQISDISKTYLSDTDLQEDLHPQENTTTHTDFKKGYLDLEDNERSNRTPKPRTYQTNKTNPVCEKTVSLEQLQKDIQAVIGETIVIPRLEKLVQSSSVERIRYHLKHWPIHKLNQVRPGAGYFLTVVENDIPPVAPPQKTLYSNTGKVPQRDMFEQREYSDEELEEFYCKLDIEETTTSPITDLPAKNTDPVRACDTAAKLGGSDSWNKFLETREKEDRYVEEVFKPMVLPACVLLRKHAQVPALPGVPLEQEDELTDAVTVVLSEEAVQEDLTEHVPDDEGKFSANLVEEEECEALCASQDSLRATRVSRAPSFNLVEQAQEVEALLQSLPTSILDTIRARKTPQAGQASPQQVVLRSKHPGTQFSTTRWAVRSEVHSEKRRLLESEFANPERRKQEEEYIYRQQQTTSKQQQEPEPARVACELLEDAASVQPIVLHSGKGGEGA